MAAVRYNGYLIVAVAKRERITARWYVCVDVSTRDRTVPASWFETPHQFETQEEAENSGLQLARAWIDQQLAPRCGLDSHTPIATDDQTCASTAPNDGAPVTVLSSASGKLRAEVREFAERIEAALRQDEKKKNNSWTQSSLEDLVHDVLDNTSALLMTNYNDESQRALLPAACLDLATLAFIISRKSTGPSTTQPRRLAEQIAGRRSVRIPGLDARTVSEAETPRRKRGPVIQLRLKDPPLRER